jgi:Lrp/AsnC family transcriptional regulator for asnA, asnC and gidA
MKSTRLTDLLQQDGRTSNSKLAESLGVTEATVRRRIAQLDEAGVMRVVAITTRRRGETSTSSDVGGRCEAARGGGCRRSPASRNRFGGARKRQLRHLRPFSAYDKEHMASILLDGLGSIEGVARVKRRSPDLLFRCAMGALRMKQRLDDLDLAIIRLLEENGRTSNPKKCRVLGVSEGTV